MTSPPPVAFRPLALPDDLALVHYGADGSLEDITTSIDTVDDVICGETTSFSPFAVGILDVDRIAGSDRAWRPGGRVR